MMKLMLRFQFWQKGVVPLVFLIFIPLVLVAVGVTYYLKSPAPKVPFSPVISLTGRQILTPVVTKPQSRGGSRGGAVDCASGWQEYKNDKFGFSFKIPSGWSDATIEEMQPEDLAYRSLISTLVPEQQLDPRYKISRFEILASTGDLKTHPDYGRWFDNNTGNQVKSTVEFKGLTDVEKYVDETEMPCSSQTDNNPVSCAHRLEMYYFKKDNVYYLLNIGIYTTAELKEKNEAILNCFLENFQL